MLKNDLEEYGIIMTLQALNIVDLILCYPNIDTRAVLREFIKELNLLRYEIEEHTITDVTKVYREITNKIIKKYTKGVEQCLNY